MTVVVVGDVGGCSEQLKRVVGPLVAEPGTVVVQVGDLVDRGPDSAGVLAFVRERLEGDRRRWVQLIGNHEAPYVGGESFWPEPLGEAEAGLLRSWWLREWMRVAVAVRTADGEELLITHAGLSRDAWRDLGAPVTAGTAAALLNTRPEPLLFSYEGPLWAEAGQIYPSWLGGLERLPFSQVHGHSTIVSFDRRTWLCEERIRWRSTVDWQARHTETQVPGGRFVGVDPKHGLAGAPEWAPLVLPGAEVIS
ncbi:calcineurin-like phosphoesterase family protein [Actinoplanes lutulentus]|uniref:Calcineurin-like phosphoesterase family protein n=1 Tax=Actinoplanes lutulentus TaxID=1287878 RepID=A0A327Z9R4_9ACTN|nr:calcineurin-like phosphoesterase family protein [Actinoplanes lutulentus]